MNRVRELKKIKDEILALSTSPLYKYRVKNNYLPVVGEGSCYSQIMLIGEAPGKNEALTGLPFCGAAGRVLDQLFVSTGINRKEVYITSIVKDRPPQNRDPSPKEIRIYGEFLDRQIEIIRPKVIGTLGRHAMSYVMKKFGLDTQLEPIGKAHGKIYSAQASYGPIHIVALYHPSVALYSRKQITVLKQDFKILKKYGK